MQTPNRQGKSNPLPTTLFVLMKVPEKFGVRVQKGCRFTLLVRLQYAREVGHRIDREKRSDAKNCQVG